MHDLEAGMLFRVDCIGSSPRRWSVSKKTRVDNLWNIDEKGSAGGMVELCEQKW